MAVSDPLYSIILAGGKGRRMRSRDKHKVCFEIAGVPAIIRAIDAYNRLGVVLNVVVVGDLAAQVVETVGRRFSNVVYAYQPEARGTGDAARCGLQALATADDRARILVVAGDKLIASATLSRLLDQSERTKSDLSILVTPAQIAAPSAGRVLFRPDGSPLAIVEMSDIRLRACRQELSKFLETAVEDETALLTEIIARHLGSTPSLTTLLGINRGNGEMTESVSWEELCTRLCQVPQDFRFGPNDQVVGAAEALHSRFCNESVYLVRKGALRYGLNHMPTDNAQGEEYLTDAIGAILPAGGDEGRRYIASFLATERPGEVLSYNNPEELLVIEDRLQGQRRRALDQLSERLGREDFASWTSGSSSFRTTISRSRLPTKSCARTTAMTAGS